MFTSAPGEPGTLPPRHGRSSEAGLEFERIVTERPTRLGRALSDEAPDRFSYGAIVGLGAAVRSVLEQIKHVAPTDSTVLLLGETGTGKELFATHIHERAGVTSARWCASTAPPFPPR